MFNPPCFSHFIAQDALDILAEECEYRNNGQDGYARALAFRRASAVLKSRPTPVRWVAEVRKLPHIGGHTLGVIKVCDTQTWQMLSKY